MSVVLVLSINNEQNLQIYIPHIHWVTRQNKLEIPRDKDEVNEVKMTSDDVDKYGQVEGHECRGHESLWVHHVTVVEHGYVRLPRFKHVSRGMTLRLVPPT